MKLKSKDSKNKGKISNFKNGDNHTMIETFDEKSKSFLHHFFEVKEPSELSPDLQSVIYQITAKAVPGYEHLVIERCVKDHYVMLTQDKESSRYSAFTSGCLIPHESKTIFDWEALFILPEYQRQKLGFVITREFFRQIIKRKILDWEAFKNIYFVGYTWNPLLLSTIERFVDFYPSLDGKPTPPDIKEVFNYVKNYLKVDIDPQTFVAKNYLPNGPALQKIFNEQLSSDLRINKLLSKKLNMEAGDLLLIIGKFDQSDTVKMQIIKTLVTT